MTTSLRVSISAVEIRRYASLGDLELHLSPLVARAAAAGSHLLLLPELLCVGLLWTDSRAAEAHKSAVKSLYRRVLNRLFADYCDILSGLARKHKIVIAGASCWHERDGRAINTALWCRPDGAVQFQDKLHPTRAETAIDTVGGDQVSLFQVDGVSIGLIVCYDVQFPELSRNLVDAGAQLILVPSLTDVRGYWRVRHCAQARAIENQIFVGVSPLIGNLGVPVDYAIVGCGRPLIACPIDNRFCVEDGVLAEGDMNREGVVHCALDFDTLRLSRTRSEIMQRADRRPDLYARPVARL